nr:RNA-directed DNA polymerase, eukaryota [Tanacetum cinerariifolium]
MSKVKEVSAIPNLRIILTKEGFQPVNISYLGGLWVLIEFDSSDSIENFCNHKGVRSWFESIKPACNSFVPDERIIWVSIEGLPIISWTTNTFSKWLPNGVILWYGMNLKKRLCLELDAWIPKFLLEDDSDSSDEDSNDFDGGGKFGDMEFINPNDESDAEKVSESSYDFDPTHPPGFTLENEKHIVKDTISSPKDQGNLAFDHAVSSAVRNSRDSNGLICIKKKLQLLKSTIKTWVKENKANIIVTKSSIQHKLSEVDKVIDQGGGTDEIINLRSSLIKDLNDSNSIGATDLSQKAKIRWSIEGVENSKFFHGIRNSTRSQTAIRGIFLHGDWVMEPKMVKAEFFNHFSNQFSKPTSSRINIDFEFPSRLNLDQVEELERHISLDEIKKAVWECGTNKPPGSILINGSPTSEFHFYKGLKQGDPLFPFLFILVMESLHLSFSRVLESGLFKGINLNNSLMISHLFYADDAIFIRKWDISNIKTIVKVLKRFFLASGLKINLHKSKITGIGVTKDRIDLATNLMGCSTFAPPFHYLGVKVGAPMSRKDSWKDVTSKLSARLSKWKLKTLSIGGRLTHLKSVLTAVSIYYMSLYKVPIGILNEMEAIRRDFFQWFIKAIHGENGAIDTHISSTKGSVWLELVRDVSSLKKKGIDLLAAIKMKLGNEENTLFWIDK